MEGAAGGGNILGKNEWKKSLARPKLGRLPNDATFRAERCISKPLMTQNLPIFQAALAGLVEGAAVVSYLINSAYGRRSTPELACRLGFFLDAVALPLS